VHHEYTRVANGSMLEIEYTRGVAVNVLKMIQECKFIFKNFFFFFFHELGTPTLEKCGNPRKTLIYVTPVVLYRNMCILRRKL
jgi:hypothetical protein